MINGEFTMDKKYIYKNDEIEVLMEDAVGYYATEKQRVKALGIPVPEFFTISSEVFEEYKNTQTINETVKNQIWNNIKALEEKLSKKIGNDTFPLMFKVVVHTCEENEKILFSVSNVGINKNLVKTARNTLWAFECYANFLLKYVAFLDESENKEEYKSKIKKYFTDLRTFEEAELPKARFEINKKIIQELNQYYKDKTNSIVSDDVKEQILFVMERAYKALLKSFNSKKIAITIEEMKFGNLNGYSGIVRLTSRSANGKMSDLGKYVCISQVQSSDLIGSLKLHPSRMVPTHMVAAISRYMSIMEKAYKEVQKAEFVYESGNLFLLERHNYTPKDTELLKILVDMEKEKVITKEEMLLKLKGKDFTNYLPQRMDYKNLKDKKIGRCVKSMMGVFYGNLIFIDEYLGKEYGESTGKDILVIDNEKEELDRFLRPAKMLRDTIRGVIIRSDIGTVDNKLETFFNAIKMPYTMVRDKKENMKKIKQVKIGKRNFYDDALITVDTNSGKVYKGRVTKCLATEELKTIWKYNKELNIIEFPKEIRESFTVSTINSNGKELMIIKESSPVDNFINFFKRKS